MNKLVKLLILFTLILNTSTMCFALTDEISEELLENEQEQEVVLELNNPIEELNPHDASIDNVDIDFEGLKNFEKPSEKKHDTLIGKVLKSDIVRTDIPTYLFQDDLTFHYENGLIRKTQFMGAYKGSINAFWNNPYTTHYENMTTQFGSISEFKNSNYKFKVLINPIPIKDKSYMENFFENISFINSSIPNHQIHIGYTRVHTGMEGGTSGKILPFVNRSQIARNFGNAKSLSAKILGNYQYVDYTVSVGSSGRTIIDGMPGAEFNGWINFKPLGDTLSKKYGKVTIGGGLHSGHNNIDYNVGSMYLGYHYKKLWTNFEAGIADGYNGAKGYNSNKATGYAATLGWKFTPHWQLIGRVDQFDSNRNKSGDLQREYTLGLNWFIKGQALKLVLNYVFCDNQNKHNSHKLILATQVLI